MEHDIYKTPESSLGESRPASAMQQQYSYAGFWIRVGAALIDGVIITAITLPVLIGIYGPDYMESTKILHGPAEFVISYVFPAVAVILFWMYKGATPGKMACKLKIIDVNTGGKPTPGQHVGRYFGYFVSTIPLGLGLIWVAFDDRNQGWHDKMSSTAVVKIH